MRGPLKPAVEDGAHYYDQAVVVKSNVVKDRVRLAVSAAFNGGRPEIPPSITVGHDRVRLRWMKPGPNGKLVPR